MTSSDSRKQELRLDTCESCLMLLSRLTQEAKVGVTFLSFLCSDVGHVIP